MPISKCCQRENLHAIVDEPESFEIHRVVNKFSTSNKNYASIISYSHFD